MARIRHELAEVKMERNLQKNVASLLHKGIAVKKIWLHGRMTIVVFGNENRHGLLA
ncbi:MAG: hypothetical protein KA524_10195 [Nitrosomonas sp.]|nr:hypothetical protein [Nitrosomonas sp.]MBP6076734.1 hypothetical protein [Nitrosomonas sp.]